MSRGKTYPDITIRQANGNRFTVKTIFEAPINPGAGEGTWVTHIIDPTHTHDGKMLGSIQIGGAGVTNYTARETEMTRDNFRGIIRRNTPN